jgi:hypothetical protein
MIDALPPHQSLSGHDAYCHVCWEPVYTLWVDSEDPKGVCPFGETKATECAFAMNRARLAADIRKMMNQCPR